MSRDVTAGRGRRSRFLTPTAKAGILDRWEECKADFARRVEAGDFTGDLGGRGFPDPAIYDFCDALNAIEGICTIQSCSGHRVEQVEKHGWHEDGPLCWKGQIWICLDRTMRDLFLTYAGGLSRKPGIEVVALLLGRYREGDTADIIFDGLDVEKDPEGTFVRSQEIILHFFERLRAEADDDS